MIHGKSETTAQQASERFLKMMFDAAREARPALISDNQTACPTVTKRMIDAARMAEYRHYYGDRSPASHTWVGTPVMVIAKMLQAALTVKEIPDAD